MASAFMSSFLRSLVLMFGVAIQVSAQTNNQSSSGPNDHSQLAVAIQNPFASLYTLPIQNNLGLEYGTNGGVQNITNLQPVIPFHISERWKLLTHPIIPLAYTSWPEKQFGLGDINFEAAFSDITHRGWVLGFGIISGFPTATNEAFGTGKWTIGPLLGAFHQYGNWTVSLLLTQEWSYAGDASRSLVSTMQLQPNINYNFKDGLYLFTNPQITANFIAEEGQQWIVPVGVGLGKVFSVSQQKMSLSLESYRNVVRPDVGPATSFVLTLQLLFPRQVW